MEIRDIEDPRDPYSRKHELRELLEAVNTAVLIHCPRRTPSGTPERPEVVDDLCRILQDMANEMKAENAITYDDSLRAKKEEALVLWDDRTLPSIRQFRPGQLAGTLYSHFKLRTQPTAEWKSEWLNVTHDKLKHLRSPQLLTNMLTALAQLGLKPPVGWMREWFHAIHRLSGEMSEMDWVHGLHALAVLSTHRDVSFSDAELRFWHEGVNAHPPESVIGRMQCYMAYKAFGWEPKDWMLEALDEMNSSKSYSFLTSSLEEQFIPMLIAQKTKRSLPVLINQETWNDSTASRVDLVLTMPAQHPEDKAVRLWVQLDGPSHFVDAHHGQELDGNTRLQTVVLANDLPPDEKLIRVAGVHFALDGKGTVNKVLDRLEQLYKVVNTPCNQIEHHVEQGRTCPYGAREIGEG